MGPVGSWVGKNAVYAPDGTLRHDLSPAFESKSVVAGGIKFR